MSAFYITRARRNVYEYGSALRLPINLRAEPTQLLCYCSWKNKYSFIHTQANMRGKVVGT
jgi:hypothetical protein